MDLSRSIKYVFIGSHTTQQEYKWYHNAMAMIVEHQVKNYNEEWFQTEREDEIKITTILENVKCSSMIGLCPSKKGFSIK